MTEITEQTIEQTGNIESLESQTKVSLQLATPLSVSSSIAQRETHNAPISTLDLHRDELTPTVQTYADNLAEQVKQELQKIGVPSISELTQQVRQGVASLETAQHIQMLMSKLNAILETGKIPRDEMGKWAEEILGEDFLGPEQVKKAFGIELDIIPDIPFTQDELERAKELDQMLILRTDKAPDGQPLTMQKMQGLLQPQFNNTGKGKILFGTDWHNSEQFFTSDTPSIQWALVSKKVVPNSTNKNYLQQTGLLVDYLKQEVFRDIPIPLDYQTAIHEFESEKGTLNRLIYDERQIVAQKLSELELNKLTRRTPSEELFDLLVYFQNTEQRLLEDRYDWTIGSTSGNELVYCGHFVTSGAGLSRTSPGSRVEDMGVCFSRTQ